MRKKVKVKGKVNPEIVTAVETWAAANLSDGKVIELSSTKVLLRDIRDTETVKERDLQQVEG